MAGQPWNKVNIPFPCAVSSVRIQYTATTDACVKSVLAENETVLKLVRCEILQTEIRVLYDLLYVLNNSCRGHKTFRALKQVEQCINRLKDMKLDAALQELSDLCLSGRQRAVSIKAAEGAVPSQPMLEWICLKVLGAAQLMKCTMTRCSRAFVLSKQHLKWEEFIVLNLVISSLLSRLWVIFRGVLASLSTLYLELLKLRGVVSDARPMPFLTSFSLPTDVVDFLGPGGSVPIKRRLQTKKPGEKKHVRQKQKKQGRSRTVPEDLGVAVHRGLMKDSDMKPFLNIFRKCTEGQWIRPKAQKKQTFQKQMRGAACFTDVQNLLERRIRWCKSHRKEREKRRLTFLRLKCHRMRSLEAAGYNVHRNLRTFRQEVDSALRKTPRPAPSTRRTAGLRNRVQTLKREMMMAARGRRRRRRKWADGRMRTRDAAVAQTSGCDDHDDIDHIFAYAGL